MTPAGTPGGRPIGGDGTVDISPSKRLFISEAGIIAALHNGIRVLLEKEKQASS